MCGDSPSVSVMYPKAHIGVWDQLLSIVPVIGVIFGESVRLMHTDVAPAEVLNHGFVFVAVLRAIDGAGHAASGVSAVLAGNRGGDYLFRKERIMNPPTEKRNYKLHGELHPNARLTRAQVIEIRNEAKVPGTSRAWLARRYGVSRSCIDRIVLEQTWREAL